MDKWQCPACKSNMVSVMDASIICHACGNQEYLYDYANAHDNPMPRAPEPDITEIQERVGNLEAISAERGSIPRQYHDQFHQIRGELAYLQNKVAKQTPSTENKATPRGLQYQDIRT